MVACVVLSVVKVIVPDVYVEVAFTEEMTGGVWSTVVKDHVELPLKPAKFPPDCELNDPAGTSM